MAVSTVPMQRRTVMLMLAAGLTLGLGGCLFDGDPKHLKPLSKAAKALMAKKGLEPGAPLLVRIFKEEAKLEAWLQAGDGTFRHFRTYDICNWSGVLGPKLKEGDRQAPEGFYVVNPARMNPNSSYYLSFNMGFPNAFDIARKRTGSYLMVHGGCRSAGCYAVTDASIQEIFSLARDAFLGGQREFNIHAFPFRMTAENMARHRDDKWAGFWRNLKTGYDMFERTRMPPLVGVENRQYVFFDPQQRPPAARPDEGFVMIAATSTVPRFAPALAARPVPLRKPR